MESHAFPLVISEKKLFSETLCQRQKLFSETNTLRVVRLALCVTHTHTHKNTFNDRLGPNMIPD